MSPSSADATATSALARLHTIADFEEAARLALPEMAWDYFRAGADGERTLARNLAAFAEWELWPRVLVDVAERDLRTDVLGAEIAAPILIAPTAYHRMAHADGECGTARAAAAFGTVMVVSTLATTPLDEVARAASGPKWFQLYVHKDRGLTRALVEKAEAAGYRALVLTVDTPLLGRRVRDEKNGFCLPEGLCMANLAEYAGGQAAGSMLGNYIATRHEASLSWRDLAWLRSLSKLPLVLKGIVRADDAARAVEEGVAGVVVSNHGGRQLDGAPATIDALPEVVAAVGARAEVYLDGGVRWGSDALKALALGARAVLVGRPVVFGLAAAGEAGVLRVLELLAAELSRAMALAGVREARSLRAFDLVRRRRA